MSTNIETQSICQLPIGMTSVTLDDLPDELTLSILQRLGIKDCCSSRLTCRRWRAIVGDPNTIYSKYLQEIDTVIQLTRLTPNCSAWQSMPLHWELPDKEKNVLKLSSWSNHIITFQPSFCDQSSKFFSFSSSIPISDRFIFLAKYGNTYFLTEQGKAQLELELPTDLQPLASYKLTTKNFQDSSKDREISLLRDLPATPDNLSHCQIEHCFPIAENHIAIVTSGRELSFWNLSMEIPICYQTLQIEVGSELHRIDKYLIANRKIIDLTNQSSIEQEFNFKNKDVIVVVLTSDGKVIHTICQMLTGADMWNPELFMYPHFSQISGNILVYKHTLHHTLYFWHILTKRMIQEFKWTNLVYDMPLLLGNGFVQDIIFHEGKLTILLAAQYSNGSNKPGKFRIIQFDPQITSQRGGINSIYSTFQSVWY